LAEDDDDSEDGKDWVLQREFPDRWAIQYVPHMAGAWQWAAELGP